MTSRKTKTFVANDTVDVIRDIDHTRWEPAIYIAPATGMRGWHWVRIDDVLTKILIPSRRIRGLK